MDIESELPENFEELTVEDKIGELERLEDVFDAETDSGAIKRRMVQELIRHYNKDLEEGRKSP